MRQCYLVSQYRNLSVRHRWHKIRREKNNRKFAFELRHTHIYASVCKPSKDVGRIYEINRNVHAQMKYFNSKWSFPNLIFFKIMKHIYISTYSALCHVDRVCIGWFQYNCISVFKWSENCFNINSIENLWVRLKKLVTQNQPSYKIHLIEAIIQSWYHIITDLDLKTFSA